MFLFLFIVPQAHAQRFRGGGTYSKRGSTENTTWTLADWMAQKAEFKLMDQWLAINTQRNFLEIGLEGSETNYEVTAGGSTKDRSVRRYSASIYVSIFGLEGGTEKTDEDLKYTWGQFNVRMFGQSSQSTSLVLGYGMRKREDSSSVPTLEVTNNYANAKLQVYVFKFLGIDGNYRKDFRATDQQNTSYEGERIEYGVFLEYQYVRLYGRAFKETTYKLASGAATTQQETREGTDAGVKFFF